MTGLVFLRTLITGLIAILGLVACEIGDVATIESAQNYVARGDYKAAEIELKAFLKQQPRSPAARWLLGETYLAMEAGASAEKELLLASELGVTDDSVMPMLVQALSQQGKHEEILSFSVDGQISANAQAEISAAQALALLAQGKKKEASDRLEEALRQAPDSPWVKISQVRLLVREKEFEKALTVLESILSSNPKNGFAWSMRGDVYLHSRQFSQADQAYSEAIKHRFSSLKDRVKRTHVRIELEQFEKVSKDIELLLRVAPAVRDVQYLAGKFYAAKREYASAADSLQNAQALDSNHFPTNALAASVYFKLGRYELARTAGERALSQVPGFVPIRRMMAQIELTSGDPAEAERLIRPIVAAYPDSSVDTQILVNALAEMGERDEAISILEKFIENRDLSTTSQLHAGIALISLGEKEKGADIIDNVTDDDASNVELGAIRIAGLLSANRSSEALQSAKTLAEKQPGDAAAANLLGLSYQANDEVEQAKKAFAKALVLDPGNSRAARHLATIAVEESDFELAKKLLHTALESHPDDVALLYTLAVISSKQTNFDEAEAILLRSIEIDGENIRTRATLAYEYIQRGKHARALQILSSVPPGRETDVGISLLKSQALLNLGRLDEAETLLESIASKAPNLVAVHHQLSRLYLVRGYLDDAEKAAIRVLTLSAKNVSAMLTRVQVAALRGEAELADQLLQSISGLDADSLDYLEVQFLILKVKGRNHEALAIAKRLHSLQRTQQSTQGLAVSLRDVGKRSAAIGVLEDWLRDHPHDLQIRRVLADIQWRGGDADAAVTTLQTALNDGLDNAELLNDLAWYLRKSDAGRALELAERAYDKNSNSAAILDTYAEVLARNGRSGLALTMIDRALLLSGDAASLKLRRAQITHLTGDTRAALREVERLDSPDYADSVRKKARSLRASWE